MALALQEEAAAPAGAGAGTVAVVNPVAAATAAVAAAQTQARPAVTFVTTVPPRYLRATPEGALHCNCACATRGGGGRPSRTLAEKE